jgi:hypothetical protein
VAGLSAQNGWTHVLGNAGMELARLDAAEKRG